MKKGKVKQTNGKESVSATSYYYCRDLPSMTLRAPHQKFTRERLWNSLDKHEFCHMKPLLPEEILSIMKKIPDDSRKKLAA
jgi:DNA-directed RNA polymerase V subunit 1